MSKKRKVKTGRVSFIALSRLYNTGNYTNYKIDLSCQIEKGESAKATLLELARIVSALAPVPIPSSLSQLKSVRRKKLSERSEYEKAHFSEWLKDEADYKQEKQKQLQAIEDLDRLGGATVMTDAKLNWENYDDDDTPW